MYALVKLHFWIAGLLQQSCLTGVPRHYSWSKRIAERKKVEQHCFCTTRHKKSSIFFSIQPNTNKSHKTCLNLSQKIPTNSNVIVSRGDIFFHARLSRHLQIFSPNPTKIISRRHLGIWRKRKQQIRPCQSKIAHTGLQWLSLSLKFPSSRQI